MRWVDPMQMARWIGVVGASTLLAASAVGAQEGYRAGTASDFAGQWQFASPDGTNEEIVELVVRGAEVTGEITALEHGYFSRRTTVKANLIVRGSLSNGALQLRFWNAEGSPDDAKAATGRLRGEYFILRIGESETGNARPGRSHTQITHG